MMKKVLAFIPAVLWLALAIYYFADSDYKKGIVFTLCGIGIAIVELFFALRKKRKS